MEGRFLILDITEHQNWGPVRAVQDCPPLNRPLGIPANCRPTVLQLNHQVAIREIRRLAKQAPDRTFALFEMTCAMVTLPIVTHVNVYGKPMKSATVQSLMPIAQPAGASVPADGFDDDDLPF